MFTVIDVIHHSTRPCDFYESTYCNVYSTVPVYTLHVWFQSTNRPSTRSAYWYIFNPSSLLTSISFRWLVCLLSIELHTIFTLDNVRFLALKADGFLRNALLALFYLINDLGHVVWNINTISIVIKKKEPTNNITLLSFNPEAIRRDNSGKHLCTARERNKRHMKLNVLLSIVLSCLSFRTWTHESLMR